MRFHVAGQMLGNVYAREEGLTDQASDCSMIICCCIRNVVHNSGAGGEIPKLFDVGQDS